MKRLEIVFKEEEFNKLKEIKEVLGEKTFSKTIKKLVYLAGLKETKENK